MFAAAVPAVPASLSPSVVMWAIVGQLRQVSRGRPCDRVQMLTNSVHTRCVRQVTHLLAKITHLVSGMGSIDTHLVSGMGSIDTHLVSGTVSYTHLTLPTKA